MIEVGIDLVEIARITDICTKNPRFITRFFGTEEQEFFSTKSDGQRMQSIAANFAAKEAFFKAIGTGINGNSLKDVQALRCENGKPYLSLSGKICEIVGAKKISISLSHTDSLATAIVIIDG